MASFLHTFDRLIDFAEHVAFRLALAYFFWYGLRRWINSRGGH